ncbi:MAG: hypothetical protein IKQ83_03685 [Lachnospiraceae bacterium]|nr:hypothetical protein [Lachnospiraceae bacterium]
MKKSSLIKVIIFISVLILPTLLWGVKLVFTDKAEINESYARMEATENRSLSKWPDNAADKDYTSKLESYFNDRVPFREKIIDFGHKFNGSMEQAYTGGIQPVIIRLFYGNRGSDSELAQTDGYDTEEVAVADADEQVTDEADTVNKDEHDYVEKERVEATCEEEGYILYECTDCGDTYKESIPALGHKEELIEQAEASYTEYGHSLYKCSVCGKRIWKDYEPKLTDTSYFPLKVENNYTVMGRQGWLFYRGDASLKYYTGENVLDEAQMKERLDALISLKKVCDDKDIKLVYMIIPNKEIVYPEYMPTMDIVSERKKNEIFAEYVKKNSDVNLIYPLEELKEAKKYYNTYYAYDTHWNEYGAFVGTMALYDALGMETIEASQADAERSQLVAYGLVLTGALTPEDYSGSEDYIVNYKPDLELVYEEGEKNYLFSYTNVYKSEALAENDERIVFIGDSFREWMIPYLSKDFTHTCLVQRDNIPDIADEIKQADILVVSAVERFDEDIYARIPQIIRILNE